MRSKSPPAESSPPDSPARDLPSVLADLNTSLRDDLVPDFSEEGRSSSSKGSANEREHGGMGAEIGIDVNKQLHDTHRENLRDTVFLRAEAIPEKEMKAISLAQFIGQSFAVILLTLEVVLKYVWTDKHYLLSKASEWWNVVYAIVCFVAVLACLIVLTSRIIKYRHKLWGKRRKVLVSYNFVEAVILLVALATIVIPNIFVLSQDCTWFSYMVRINAFIHWTCWNTLFMIIVIDARNINFWKRKGKVLTKHGRDRLVLDAPIWIHTGVGINWLVFEAINICLFVMNSTRYNDRFVRAASRCNSFDYNCHQHPASLALQCILFASWLMWIVLWFFHILKGLQALHQRPWHKYKMANTVLRVQIKARLNSIIVFALCLILLIFLKINSCATYIQTWLGLGPMAAMEAATIISNMYFYMPKSPDLKEPMIQAMMQEFIWSEEHRSDSAEQRLKRLKVLSTADENMPLFCFQTAIKSFYFAALIYEYQEDKAAAASDRQQSDPTVQGYSIEQALDLYNLERFELLVEPAEDTKVLLCWNADTVCLSFRGTASMTNVLADLQVWMSDHPPKRGRFYKRPQVHAGFLKAWCTNNLNHRVMDRMRSIFESPGVRLKDMRVHLTGHSLGGALASLAAIDIAREFAHILDRSQIMCYTFGAPRTGNHTFARECNVAVPETWNIMNSQDIVPRSGKFIHKYKAHGQRVIVNKMGDMLVRPTFVEFSASQSLPFQSRVQDHYLATYQASFVAVCTAQFGQKRFKDGVDGLHDLISSGVVHDVLSDNKLDEKIMAEGWGGVTLFQIQNQVARGVGKLQAGAKGAVGMNKPERKPEKSESRIHWHDGVCWREAANDNLQSDSNQTLTRSSKDLRQRSRHQAQGTASSRQLPRSGPPPEPGVHIEASQDTERDLEHGLSGNDAERAAAGNAEENKGGAQPGFAAGAGTGSSGAVPRQSFSARANGGASSQVEQGGLSSKAQDSRVVEAREKDPEAAAPQTRDKGSGHWHLPSLPGFLRRHKGQKAPLRLDATSNIESRVPTEQEEQSSGAPLELHLSRDDNHHSQHQADGASGGDPPTTSSEQQGAAEEERSLGAGDRPRGRSKLSGHQETDHEMQLASLSSRSLSSVGSARSFTLEENLRRMEKQGTLHEAIVAAEAGHRKKKANGQLPRLSRAPPEMGEGPREHELEQRAHIFHHSKTGPVRGRHDKLDHSLTL